MSEHAEEPEPDPLEVAVNEAIAACGGDVRAAIKALIAAKLPNQDIAWLALAALIQSV